jgi:hypothetical protein
MSDWDDTWKEALEQLLPLFLAFFFPKAHAGSDWTRDYDSLDQELRKLAPLGEVGKRLADRLVKVWRASSDDPSYLHVEVQCQPEAEFGWRVYTYNYRAEDRFKHPVVSLVVLGDENPEWRPKSYEFELYDCKKTFVFPMVKLLDWRGREAELEAHPNPFGLLVLAHLRAQDTRDAPEARRDEKVRILKLLAGRGLDAEDLRQWYRFLDWLLDLSPQLEREVWLEMDRFTKEGSMPFVTYAERVGFDKGEEQGLKKGEEKGLLQGIESVLEVRFGPAGLALLPDVRQVTDLKVLQAVLQASKTARTPEDLRPLLAKAAPDAPGGGT